MSYDGTPPSNFKVINKDQDPTMLVEVHWTSLTTSDLRQDYVLTNTAGRVTNTKNYITEHARTMVGYRLHRGTTSNFTPSGDTAGTGTCIAHENTLVPTANDYTDTSVLTGINYYYKIATVFNS